MSNREIVAVVLLLILDVCYGRTARGVFTPGRTDLFELSVIHLNDFHARFEEVSPTGGTCHEDERQKCIGGFARVYTATRQLLDERPNAVFLNAGDHFQGTLWYNIFRWNVTVTFMNMLPHDVMTIGNHEFDNGVVGVVPFLQKVNAPVVVANIDASEEPTFQGLTKNSTIIIRGGRKIGVIGIIYSKTNTMANTGKLKFLDEVETVNLEAEKLKKNEDVDIIVVLSHAGIDVDRIVAAKCPTVDLIVGGHSHSFLYSGPPPSIDKAEDDYPVVVTHPNTNKTVLIVQAAAYTKYLGNLSVWFDTTGEIVDWEGNPILLDQGIKQDPQILEALKPWKNAIDVIGKAKLGITKVILDNDCGGKECNLANFATDAMVDAWMGKSENVSHWTYAAIACINSGNFRTPIGNRANDFVTYNDVITAMPFENTWDIVELQGRDIIRTLESNIDRGYALKMNTTFRRILHWSGLRTTFDISKEAGSRLVDVAVRCQKCDMPKYEKIDLDEWYRVVIPSYLVNGGDDEMIIANNHRNHIVGSVDIDHLVDYIKRASPIIQGNDNRLVVRDF